MMAIVKKEKLQAEEQKWENPLNPEKPGDARDQEQALRQQKEAKRRKENLTATTQTSKQKTNHN